MRHIGVALANEKNAELGIFSFGAVLDQSLFCSSVISPIWVADTGKALFSALGLLLSAVWVCWLPRDGGTL